MEKAFDYIREQRGQHFDPDCAEIFVNESALVLEIHNALSESA
jgi:response regulator RpfG family c-di-GMP phosphodiesterase